MNKYFQTVVHFLFELGQLKRQPHTGWWRVGVKDPYSVADHTMRATLIGYILAVLEGANPERVASMVAMHDIGEARIQDRDLIASKYLGSKKKGELQAITDQLASLPPQLGIWLEYFKEYSEKNTPEGRCAFDADCLEQAVSAKELVDLGHKHAALWLDSCEQSLTTNSAKELLALIRQTDSQEWFVNILHQFKVFG